MQRLTTLLLAFGLLLPACGGGSDNPIAVITGLVQAAGCTAGGVEDYSLAFDQIEAALQLAPVPSVLDIDVGTGASRLVLQGTIADQGGTLADGFTVGDTVEVTITSAMFGGVVSGNGTLVLEHASAVSIVVSGTSASMTARAR